MTGRRRVLGMGLAALASPLVATSGRAQQLPRTANLDWVFRSDAGAQEFVPGYNKQFWRVPERRALCGDADAVSAAIAWARDTDTNFALRSGGHCFMGFSQHDNLVIDTRRIDSIRYDPTSGDVHVGAGVRIGPLYRALAEHGRVLSGGTFGNVGIAGLTLGGGFGYRARRDGLTIDQLRSVDLVLADGRQVRADARNHPDLFWACRGGGGGQFAIATGFTFRTAPAGPEHWIRIVEVMDIRRAAETLFLWQRWTNQSPRHITTQMQIARRGASGFLVALSGLSGGDRDGLMQELTALLRRSEVLNDAYVVSGDSAALARQMNPGESVPKTDLLTHSHMFNRPMEGDEVKELIRVILAHPSSAADINIEAMGGAMADVAPGATAFPHRDAIFTIHLQAAIAEPGELAPKSAAIEALNAVLTPMATGGVYVNYPDLSLADYGRAYWGDNLGQLQAIKRKWDPGNMFDHAQSVARA